MVPVGLAAVTRRVPPVAVDAVLLAAATLDAVVDDRGSHLDLILSLVAAAAILLRRRRPWIALLATLPGLVASDIFLAPEVALFFVALSARRRIWPFLGGLLVLLGQMVPTPPPVISNLAPGGIGRVSAVTLQLVYSVLFAAAPVFLGLLVQARQQLLAQVQQLTAGQAREQRLVTERALAVERAHLAREMHDVVAHNVSLVALQAGALRVTASDRAVADGAGTIHLLAVRTLDELRHMVGVLRAAGADSVDLAPQPTLADLDRLVASCGLPVDLAVDPQLSRVCGALVERAVYRTVQEGLTNINKHAPGAPTSVEVRRGGNDVSVRVANRPTALAGQPALPPGGHGLIGLRERAELLGGSLDARPTADGGYVLEATFGLDHPRIGRPPRSSQPS